MLEGSSSILCIFTFTCRLPAVAASQGDRDYERLREAVIHIPIIHFPAMLRFSGIREVIPWRIKICANINTGFLLHGGIFLTCWKLGDRGSLNLLKCQVTSRIIILNKMNWQFSNDLWTILIVVKLVFMSNLLWTPWISMPLSLAVCWRHSYVQFLSTLPLTEAVLSVKSLSSYFSLAKMPPKKAASNAPSKKAENKKKDKVIEVSEFNNTNPLNILIKVRVFNGEVYINKRSYLNLCCLGQNVRPEEQEGHEATEVHSASGKASEVGRRSQEPKEVSIHVDFCGPNNILSN